MPNKPLPALVLLGVLLSLVSCETTPDHGALDSSNPATPQLSWKLWGKKVVLMVNHVPYEVFADGHSYDPLMPQQFSSYGVPESALAATFVMSNAPDESNNHGFYAEFNGKDVIVYGTLYDPGFLHDPSWERVARIPYTK